MAETKSSDGRYWAIEQGDGNFVLYDLSSGRGVAVWDRWTFERTTGSTPVPEPPPDVPPPEIVRPGPPSRFSEVRRLRVTDPQDGLIIPRTYSYWANTWVGEQTYYVFCGTSNGPAFFSVDQHSEAVRRWGNLTPYGGETEGWFWLADGSLIVLNGSTLVRCHPFNPAAGSTIVLDISEDHPGCDLWQPHASDDGSTYSATVRRVVSEGKYPNIGTIAIRRGQKFYDPAEGDLDESHLSGDGRYLIIEQDNNDKIINLDTRETRRIGDWEGALAHLDCGPDFMVGEADKPDPGQCALYYLDRPLTPANKITLFLTLGMGHLSVKGGRCLLSDDTYISLVSLSGEGRTPIFPHGMVGGGYDRQVKANWDPTGQVACFLSNFGSDRQDLYLLEVP